jgi:uncharacterized protein (DUF983 family)
MWRQGGKRGIRQGWRLERMACVGKVLHNSLRS